MRGRKVVIGIGLGVVVLLAVWLVPHWLRSRDAGELLKRHAVYRVLEKHEPEVYARVREKFAATTRDAAGDAEFTNFANAQLAEAATRRLATASDQAVVALVRDMVSTAKSLSSAPGDACFRFWFPDVSGPPDIAAHVDAAAQSHTLGTIAEVIRSAAESPVELPSGEAVADKLADVVNATFEQFGADAQMIAHAEDPRVDRGKVCTMTIALYERILAWPAPDAAAIIRTMTQVG